MHALDQTRTRRAKKTTSFKLAAVYKPDEWPSDGAGQIVARKFLDGHIGWYAGPDAGPRSDPAAFQPRGPAMVYQPDGTITVNGVEADTAVQKMFGGKVRDAGP